MDLLDQLLKNVFLIMGCDLHEFIQQAELEGARKKNHWANHH